MYVEQHAHTHEGLKCSRLKLPVFCAVFCLVLLLRVSSEMHVCILGLDRSYIFVHLAILDDQKRCLSFQVARYVEGDVRCRSVYFC